MGTTPNFLWLEAILRHARAYLGARPDSPHTAHYLESVVAAQAVFGRTRLETDQAYIKWRALYHEVIEAHKAIRLAYDAARRECVEWGFDQFPDHFVSYLEEAPTQAAANEMLAFLKGIEIDTDWHEQAIAALQLTLAAAKERIQVQTEEFRHYRAKVRERKLGYDRAYSLTKELFAALKPDLERDSDDFRRLSPYPIT